MIYPWVIVIHVGIHHGIGAHHGRTPQMMILLMQLWGTVTAHGAHEGIAAHGWHRNLSLVTTDGAH